MRLKSIILFFAILLCSPAFAQTIGVASFEHKETDLTANLKETIVWDQNGDKCALIKILTTQRGFTFDVGTLGVTKTEEHPSQIWVYVPHGIRKISIYHPTLGSLVDWPIPIAIESAMTYQMKITSDEVSTIVHKRFTSDYLVIRPTPPDAAVYVNDELWDIQDGVATRFLPYGTYSYRIEAPEYHTATGKIALDNGKKDVEIKLIPAFGYLVMQGGTELDGATLRIDNKQVAFTENDKIKLSSGVHTIILTKEFYRPFSRKITIEDDVQMPVTVQFESNFSYVTITAPHSDVEIVVNGKPFGTGKWQGKLMAGSHRVEGKRKGHMDVATEIVVEGTQSRREIKLEENIPIYGSVNITSTPGDCTVELDGKSVGKTPLLLPEVLVGQHELRLTKNGYSPVTRTLTIAEHNTETCAIDLKKEQAAPAADAVIASSAAASAGMAGEKAVNPVVTSDCRINGYEYVDLGLSVKWATCNIGASKPEEYGRYFAWGDVTGQTWDGAIWSGGGFESSPAYEVDANRNLKSDYDAAHVLLGGSWRMPTKEELKELKKNCTCTWTSNYKGTGIAGRVFASKKTGYTGRSIFLPASGYGDSSNLNLAGSYGYYWSRTFYGVSSAWNLYFSSGDVHTSGSSRGYGQSIRPVSE